MEARLYNATVLSAGWAPWHVFAASMQKYGLSAGNACLAVGGKDQRTQKLVLIVVTGNELPAETNDFTFDDIPEGISYLCGATIHTLDTELLVGRKDRTTGADLPVAKFGMVYISQLISSDELHELAAEGLTRIMDTNREYVIVGEVDYNNAQVVFDHIKAGPQLSQGVGGVWVAVVGRLCTRFTPESFIAD